jgi:hypothetical protein
MGFFKKIGAAVKKGVKQISLKNIVKVGTPLLSMIPIVGGLAENVVGGLSAAHQAKKDAKAMEQAQAQAEAEAVQQQAIALQQAGQQAQAQAVQQKANALTSKANNLAMEAGAMVGQQAGSIFNAFSKGVVNEGIAQAGQGFQQTSGIVGATVLNNTLTEWLKMHWMKLALGLGVLGGLIFFLRKPHSQHSRR